MNVNLIRQTTKEDYDRRIEKLIPQLLDLEKRDETGLFKRLLTFDRQGLYECMGKVLNVSQSSVLQNRDELSFLESLYHFFSYYMYDDGELTIKYQKYILNDGVFIDCFSHDKNARPYLDYATDGDFVVYQQDIMKMLNKVQRKINTRIFAMRKWHKDNPGIKKSIESINYF